MKRSLFGLLTLGIIISFSVAASNCNSRSGRIVNNVKQSKKDSIRVITAWSNDVRNDNNYEFVSEVAFNEGISEDSVTQKMLDERYEVKVYKVIVIMFIGTHQEQREVLVSTFDTDQMYYDLSSIVPFDRADSINIASITPENE